MSSYKLDVRTRSTNRKKAPKQNSSFESFKPSWRLGVDNSVYAGKKYEDYYYYYREMGIKILTVDIVTFIKVQMRAIASETNTRKGCHNVRTSNNSIGCNYQEHLLTDGHIRN